MRMNRLCISAIALGLAATACTSGKHAAESSASQQSRDSLAFPWTPSSAAEPRSIHDGDRPSPTIRAYPPAGLSAGNVGSAVARLQSTLETSGFRTGDLVDGVYGPGTSSAVLAFEKFMGLERDGQADAEMLAALESLDAIGPPTSNEGPAIEIDLERQIMFATSDAGDVTILNTSTGSGELYRSASGQQVRAITPIGGFRIERRIDGVRRAYLGSLYRPLYFRKGWAIHGSGSVPAYPASHGCARVRNDDQDWLFDTFDDGVPVNVHTSLPRSGSDRDSGMIH